MIYMYANLQYIQSAFIQFLITGQVMAILLYINYRLKSYGMEQLAK